MSNAIRYNLPGGRIDLNHFTDDGRAVVEVANTVELPVPAEALERIFDRFYRVEQSRNRSRGGSGLGLAIAGEIARHHGGNVTAANLPDGRVVFRVELPLAARRQP
jgi:signal transduction histidine kinase